MDSSSLFKKIELQRIPLLNLRREVAVFIGLFNNDVFIKQFKSSGQANDSINTPYESWYGRKEVFLTRILQTSILNIESAVCSCVYLEAKFRGISSDEITAAVNNPFILTKRKAGGTAERFFNQLPSLIDEKIKLSYFNNELWEKTDCFYKEIRNPIFHGKELKKDDPSQVKECLNLIFELFKWIDSWFDLNKLIKGGGSFKKIPEFKDFIRQLVVPDFVPSKTPESRGDIYEVPSVTDVTGMLITEYLQLTLNTVDDKFMNLRMSPKAAMRLLGYLALAQKKTGWPLPKRIAEK